MLVSVVVLASCAACALGQSSAQAASTSLPSTSGSSSKASSAAAAASTVTPKPFGALTATTLPLYSVPTAYPISRYSKPADYSGLYSSYWPGAGPDQTSVEPQPVIIDPLSHLEYPEFLSDQSTVPQSDYTDYAYLPPSINDSLADPSSQIIAPLYNVSLFSTSASRAVITSATNQIIKLINSSATDASSKCNTCYAALKVAQDAVRQVPYEGISMALQLCKLYSFSTSPTCEQMFASNAEGSVAVQIAYYADLNSADATWICNSQFKVCPKPGVTSYYPTISDLVSKKKPTAPVAQPDPSLPRLKVNHLSDPHIDPRYAIGSEGNCSSSSGLCCRERAFNTALKTTFANASVPAARYGSFNCDAPYDLIISALQAIPQLTNTNETGPAWTIFTGDLVSHDQIQEITTEYAKYSETIIYQLFKRYLTGSNFSSPIFPTISNHDNRYGAGWNAPKHLQAQYIQDLYQENYNELVGLWQYEGWLTSDEAKVSRNHYTAYSAKTKYGLRIFSLNANVFYPGNIYNLLNTTNADQFGLFKFMADELQSAEDAGEKFWIIMHQDAGWDGGNALPNPTDLMYQIISRYSPHVVKAVFAGHTHEDHIFLNYANNGTNMSASTAVATTWVGPSITPLTGLNAGFKQYEVASDTFDIMNAHTWIANVSTFSQFTTAAESPRWDYEYSARQAYGKNISWPSTAPLNATWWHLVTEQMQRQPDLIELQQIYQSKSSIRAPNCTSTACQTAKVCYMRSGSQPLAARCPTGFGSTQGSG